MKVGLKLTMLAALCLALWPALVGAAPPAPKGKLVYTDDFSDPKKSKLEDNLKATDFSRGFHAPGVYHLIMRQNNETNWKLFPGQSYANFSYELELADNSDDFSGNVASGVVFRAKDDSHMYAVLLDSRKGQYRVSKLDGSTWSDLIATKPSKLIKSQANANVLRVDGDGDSFTIYLNGEQLDAFKDAAYTQGGVGMIQSNVDAVNPHSHFDNVKIYTTDAAAAGEGSPSTLPKTGQPGATEPLAIGAFALALLLLGVWVRQRR
ncbi:MAG: hypothetical protein IPO81_26855 [Kouleothrix sp.]|nr:hypothetical protein [Kouleothrix sp.]